MKLQPILSAIVVTSIATCAQAVTVPLNQSIVTLAGDADNTIEYVFAECPSCL